MNSAPLTGLREITLKSLQSGSSIMPSKINPVLPEGVTMGSAQVIGNDMTITGAGGSGNFQLNVMLPVIAKRAHNLKRPILDVDKEMTDTDPSYLVKLLKPENLI